MLGGVCDTRSLGCAGVNLGMIVYVTFIAGLTMFKNLPRQTFGRLQSKLFPQYFALSVSTVILQLATLKYGLPIGLQREQLTSLGRTVHPLK